MDVFFSPSVWGWPLPSFEATYIHHPRWIRGSVTFGRKPIVLPTGFGGPIIVDLNTVDLRVGRLEVKKKELLSYFAYLKKFPYVHIFLSNVMNIMAKIPLTGKTIKNCLASVTLYFQFSAMAAQCNTELPYNQHHTILGKLHQIATV